MFKRIAALLTLVICVLACKVAHAQLEVSEPVLDVQLPLEVENTQLQLQGQYVNNLYAYENYLHDLREDIVESETYQEAVQIYNTAEEQLKTAQQAYSLAEYAMSAPTILYDALKEIPTQYKTLLTVRGDTYGLAQPLIQLIDVGSPNVMQQYANSSQKTSALIPSTWNILDPNAQMQMQAQATAMSMRDSFIASTLQRASDVQANTTKNQNDLKTLETQTYSTDPAEHTELATLQRINTALVMMVRAQQDANQMTALSQMEHMAQSQQDLDAQKAGMLGASYWDPAMDQLQQSTQGVSAALTYTPQ